MGVAHHPKTAEVTKAPGHHPPERVPKSSQHGTAGPRHSKSSGPNQMLSGACKPLHAFEKLLKVPQDTSPGWCLLPASILAGTDGQPRAGTTQPTAPTKPQLRSSIALTPSPVLPITLPSSGWRQIPHGHLVPCTGWFITVQVPAPPLPGCQAGMMMPYR